MEEEAKIPEDEGIFRFRGGQVFHTSDVGEAVDGKKTEQLQSGMFLKKVKFHDFFVIVS